MNAVSQCSTVGGLHPLTPPPKNRSGWIRNKRVDCPVYLGLFICALCIRSGRDFRKEFCPMKSDNLPGSKPTGCGAVLAGAVSPLPLRSAAQQPS